VVHLRREKSFAQMCIILAGASKVRGVLGVNWADLAEDLHS